MAWADDILQSTSCILLFIENQFWMEMRWGLLENWKNVGLFLNLIFFSSKASDKNDLRRKIGIFF